MSDLEQKLEDLFIMDSRSRRIGRVTIAPARSSRLAGLAFVGAVAVLAVAAVVAFNVLRPPSNQVAAVPSPSPTPTVTATSTPTASPTSTPAATPSPTPTGLYVNSTSKFSVILPPPYRKSVRVIGDNPPARAQDAFTARTDAEEAAIDTSGCHTACPLWQAVAYVIVNPGRASQTTRDYYAKEEGATTSEKIEDTTVDGRPAIKVTNGAVFPMQFIIKDGDRIVVVAYQLYPPENGMAVPAGASKEKLDQILASFHFLP